MTCIQSLFIILCTDMQLNSVSKGPSPSLGHERLNNCTKLMKSKAGRKRLALSGQVQEWNFKIALLPRPMSKPSVDQQHQGGRVGKKLFVKHTASHQPMCKTIDDHLQNIIRTIVQDRQSTNYGRSKEVQRLTTATEIHQIQRVLFLAILVVFAINSQSSVWVRINRDSQYSRCLTLD